MKPGLKTSEFLGVLIGAVPAVLTVLVMFGVIGEADVSTIQDAVVAGLTAVGAFIASAVVIWKYIESRTRVKEATLMALAHSDKEQVAQIESVMG